MQKDPTTAMGGGRKSGEPTERRIIETEKSGNSKFNLEAAKISDDCSSLNFKWIGEERRAIWTL